MVTNFDDMDLMKYTYDSTNPLHPLRKREVGLFILGSMADDIIKYRARRSVEEFNMGIFDKILGDIGQESEILIGRTLWCAT